MSSLQLAEILKEVRSLKGQGNRRRYNDVVSFVAAILFGASLPSLDKFLAGLEGVGVDKALAPAPAILFLAVYFRNIHGLMAYDAWAESREYNPPFEETSRSVAFEFFFSVVAVLIAPYLSFSLIKAKHGMLQASPVALLLALFAPLAIYLFWNVYWYWRLKPASRPQDVELREYTKDWLWQDGLMLSGLLLAWAVVKFGRVSFDASFAAGLFTVVAFYVLIWDYIRHASYYFLVPVQRGRENRDFEYGEIWREVLPDGPGFCHWGGVEASNRCLEKLDVPGQGVLLDVCCGAGGTLSLVDTRTVGLDISLRALVEAKQRGVGAHLVCGDAGAMPFREGAFLAVLMQDGDAWFSGSLDGIYSEIGRVSSKNASIVIQSYISSESASDIVVSETERRLTSLGYPTGRVPGLTELRSALARANLEVQEEESLHQTYETDANRILSYFRSRWIRLHWNYRYGDVRRLGQWLEWASYLYRRRYWTGILIRSSKIKETS